MLSDLFEHEKRLMMIMIMYAGRKGLEEFELVINKKNSNPVGDSRSLTEYEMKEALSKIGMSDYEAGLAIITIHDNEI